MKLKARRKEILHSFIITFCFFSFVSGKEITCVYENDAKQQPNRCLYETESKNKSDLITGCLQLEQNPRTIYNSSIWKLLQDEYFYIKPEEIFWEENTHRPVTGFDVPYEVRQSKDGKGRGVFATRPILRGELVWDYYYHAEFENEEEWTEFLNNIASINYELACDVLQWAYVEEDNGISQVTVELDDASILNHGGAKANLGIPSGMVKLMGEDDFGDYALRDIEIDEELTTDYLKFLKVGKLLWFDQQVKDAWVGNGAELNTFLKENIDRWSYRF